MEQVRREPYSLRGTPGGEKAKEGRTRGRKALLNYATLLLFGALGSEGTVRHRTRKGGTGRTIHWEMEKATAFKEMDLGAIGYIHPHIKVECGFSRGEIATKETIEMGERNLIFWRRSKKSRRRRRMAKPAKVSSEDSLCQGKSWKR